MRDRRLLIGALVASCALVSTISVAGAPTGIESTRHNLSVSGPGPVRATNESEICVFCHAAHVRTDETPLWNRVSSGRVDYRPYSSPLMGSTPAGVNGSSLLCLSCHDGTIALGQLSNRREPLRMARTDAAGRLRADSPSNLGTDLSGSHPISVSLRDALQRRDSAARTWLREPAGPLEESLLDVRGQVQCTSCHDPHSDPAALGAPVPPFWKGESFSEVCVACHEAPIADLGHGDIRLMPDECGSCHVGHGESGEALLPKAEEENCLQCHGSPTALREEIGEGRLSPLATPVRIDDLLMRPYAHPVLTSRGEHTLGEDLQLSGARSRRHVECADCHPAHAPRSERPGLLPTRATDAPTLDGMPEHETCFRCHGPSSSRPYGATDKSIEFDPGNASYHPLVAPSRQRSPSLTGANLSGDLLTCSDCHGPDGGDPRRGPHGSRNPYLLRWPYLVRDGADDSLSSYEACYGCHSRRDILSDETFAGHSQHVVAGRISCYTCHDSHGSPDYPGLIRFNKDLRNGAVSPSSSGELSYDPETSTCRLSCHGVDHDPLGYP